MQMMLLAAGYLGHAAFASTLQLAAFGGLSGCKNHAHVQDGQSKWPH